VRRYWVIPSLGGGAWKESSWVQTLL